MKNLVTVLLVATMATMAVGDGKSAAAREVRVAYRVKSGDGRTGGGKAARYGLELVSEAVRRCGYTAKAVPVPVDEDVAALEKADADVIASSFMYPEVKDKWRFVPVRLGSADVTLYGLKDIMESLGTATPNHWPFQRVATAKGLAVLSADLREWMQLTLANVTDVEYGNLELARQSVKSGACTLFLNASAGGENPSSDWAVPVARIASHPYFAAVKEGDDALHARLWDALEDLMVHHPDVVDGIRERVFGEKPETKRVRVARYFEPGLCELQPDGTTLGANQDFVERIAEIAGWKVEWVDCRYVKALSALETGELDVVPGVTITEDRRRRFDFPLMPSGDYATYLFCRRGAAIRPDRERMGKNVILATGPGDQANAALRRLIARKCPECTIREFATMDEAELAYYRGECQVLHIAGSRKFAGEKVVYSFPAVPAYVCSTRKRPEIGRDIQHALEHLNSAAPGFGGKVTARHFIKRNAGDSHFNEEDRAFLREFAASNRTVKIELFPLADPIKSWKDGRCGGFVRALGDMVAGRTRVNLEYLEPVDEKTARNRFLNGSCDFWVDYGADTAGLPFPQGTIDAIHLKYVVICRRDTSLLDPTAGRVAVPTWQVRAFGLRFSGKYNHDLIVEYPNVEACVRAVKDGAADATICSVLAASSAVKKFDREGLLDIRTLGAARSSLPFRIIPSPSADPRLVTVFRKALVSLSSEDLMTAESAAVIDLVHAEEPLGVRILTWSFYVGGGVMVLLALVMVLLVRRRELRVRLRERHADVRYDYVVKTARSFENTVGKISSYAEYLRNPEANREYVLEWTASILKLSDDLVARFKDLVSVSEKQTRNAAEMDKIRKG